MITRSLGLLALLWLLAAPVSAQTTQVVCGIRYPVVPGLPPVQDTISKRTITDSIPCMRGGPAISNRLRDRLLLRSDSSDRGLLKPKPPIPPVPVLDTTPVSVSVTHGSGWQVLIGQLDSAQVIAKDTSGTNRNAAVVWSSSVPGVATVTQRGVVRGVSVGRTNIIATAQMGGASGFSVLDVRASDPPPSEWDREIRDTLVNGNLRVPAGQRWLIGRNVRVAGNVLVQDAVLGMRPGSQLKFLGADTARYVGRGQQYDAATFDPDIGLWVWGSGQLDIGCTPKTSWNRSGSDPTWLPGDEYWIAPTDADDTRARRWSPGQPIPQMDPRVPRAEVVNVTRDCSITGPGHIHIHSTKSQRVEYVRLDSLGISAAHFYPAGEDPALNGRYALHFHQSGEGSRGSVVRGVAMTNSRGKGFVPHESHGITFIDNVAVNSWSSAFWWDENTQTNDILVDRLGVLGVELPWEVLGFDRSAKPGVVLPEGSNMEMRDSWVAGVRGWEGYAGGFAWSQPLDRVPREWTFVQGNVAHNNDGFGFSFWSNENDAHNTQNVVAYRNRTDGVGAGAYLNGLQWTGGLLLENGLTHNQSNNINHLGQGPFYKKFRIEGTTRYAPFNVGHRNVAGDAGVYLLLEDMDLIPAAGKPKVLISNGANPWFARWVRSNMRFADFVFEALAGGNEGSNIEIDNDGNGVFECRLWVENGVRRQQGPC